MILVCDLICYFKNQGKKYSELTRLCWAVLWDASSHVCAAQTCVQLCDMGVVPGQGVFTKETGRHDSESLPSTLLGIRYP